ncbi:unnamed protein product [Didymodactylos carnosus]|uniref:Glutathione-disulfide reductase n=1 Tax=Didymodactylos carnosus TaxID=1234261 RepID=A0A8S2CNQ3_9BILA|nr:unnamed protein product [Didymodactylos carnosus]CAF3540736.1 unnamed protein product [Didymodactylos carnosus]
MKSHEFIPRDLETKLVKESEKNRKASGSRFSCKQKKENMSERLVNEVVIAVVGKYIGLEDSYASVVKALNHAALYCNRKLILRFVHASDLEANTQKEDPVKYHEAWQLLCGAQGILVPGGFGSRGIEGKISAIEWARTQPKPFLGICLGLQCAVIEFARHVLNHKGANSAEFGKSEHPVIIEMPEHNPGAMGATMRLGRRTTVFATENSVNPEFVTELEQQGMKFVGRSEDNERMEIMELENHPYFVGVQFHPEYISRPMKPSPPYLGLIWAACHELKNVLSKLPKQQQSQSDVKPETPDLVNTPFSHEDITVILSRGGTLLLLLRVIQILYIFLLKVTVLGIYTIFGLLVKVTVQPLKPYHILFRTFTMSSNQKTTENKQYDYDLFVIGGGSGGIRASKISAQNGARVALAEDKKLGGTCVNAGCVPKKLFCYASQFRELFHDASAYGWPTIDFKLNDHNWQKFIKNKNDEIHRLNEMQEKGLRDNNVEITTGHATIKDKHTVVVNGKDYKTNYILVAVGGTPVRPRIEGHEHMITSDDAFHLEKLPKNILIVGGGYIATEFSCIFNGFGSDVILIVRGKSILRSFDTDISAKLSDELKKSGIKIRFETEIKSIEKQQEDNFLVKFKDGSTTETNLVMFAVGRKPETEKLGLDAVGVKCNEKGVIQVNEFSQTNVDNIYAIGDVTDRKNLTPVAIQEGQYFANSVFGKQNKKQVVDYQNVGTTVFAEPAVGVCGLTEKEAEEKFGKDNYDVYESSFKPMFVNLPKRDRKSYVKLIVERKTEKVVGIHMIDHAAPEIIQMCSVAIRAGATKDLFDSTAGIHPTSAEEIVQIKKKRNDEKKKDENMEKTQHDQKSEKKKD